MKLKNTVRNISVCIMAVLFTLPVGVRADTDDDLNNMDYVPETEADAPNAVTNEYGDTYYEGDYNDYDHADPTERTLTLLLPSELNGRICTASGGGGSAEGTIDNGEVMFTLPWSDSYNIYVDTTDTAMPDDILTTNIPGAVLTDEGEIMVTVDMGPAWAGAVFSAESELNTYDVAFSVNDDGIATICAETDRDLIIYINYGGDELHPVYEEGEMPSDDESSEEFIGEASSDETLDAHYEAIGGEVVRDDDGDVVEIIEPEEDPEEDAEETGEEPEEDDAGTSVFLIIAIVIFAILVIAVIIYYIIRSRDRQKYKADDSVYDDYDDEDDDNEE